MKRKDIAYVAIQFILLIGFLFSHSFDIFNFPLILRYTGLIICIIGLIIIALAIMQLNKNLSPFPTPRTNGELITNGLYKWMRHPIYSGIILFTFGYAIYSNSEFQLIISIALMLLFYFKSQYEEELLKNNFPNYNLYQKKTKRFFPFI